VSVFTLHADVCGIRHRVSAESTAAGIVLNSPTGQRRVRSRSHALHLAAHEIGMFLRRAERQDAPWGLYVSVDQISAAYGAWPPLMGPPVDTHPRPSELVRIYRLWREGDGPKAALENACKIIEARLAGARAA
jgi:hypothetical protein